VACRSRSSAVRLRAVDTAPRAIRPHVRASGPRAHPGGEPAHQARMNDHGWTVELSDVRRGRRRVLDACTLRLRPGERVGLMGRNGAGKSSLLLALSGMLKNGQVLSWG